MKISKFVKLGALALLATSLCFVGCKADDDDDDAFSGGKVNFGAPYVFVKSGDADLSSKTKTSELTTAQKQAAITAGTITKADSATATKSGYKNLTNDDLYYRAFNKTNTKHRGGICEIKLTPKSTTTEDGVAGFVFDLTEDSTTGLYCFCMAAVRWNPVSKKLSTYVSRYNNVKSISGANYSWLTNFADNSGSSAVTTDTTKTSHEIEILKGDSSTQHTSYFDFKTTDFAAASDGTVTVVIKVGAIASDGSYDVGYYTDAATAKSDGENSFTNAKKTVRVNKEYTSRSNEPTGQRLLAYYANIYPALTLTANFDFSKTYGQAVVFEDAPVVE